MVGTAKSAELRTKYPIVQGLIFGSTSQLGRNTMLTPEQGSFVDISDRPLSSQGISNLENGGSATFITYGAYVSIAPTDMSNYLIVAQSGTADFIGSDDTTIQNGINSAIAQNRPLLIRAGTYTINNPLVVNGFLTMVGEGQDNYTILSAKSGLNDYVIKINSLQTSNNYRVTFQDFSIYANSASQSAGGGIVAYGIVESTFFRIHIQEPYQYGLALFSQNGESGGASGHNNRVIACLFDTGGLHTGTGLYLRNNDENEIVACEFQYLSIGALDNTGFNRFIGCSFVNNSTAGAKLTDCSRTGYNNCVFDKNPGHGLWLKGSFNIVNGCTFYDASNGNAGVNSGLLIDYYGCNNITGCSFMSDVAGECKYGLDEEGNSANNTYGNNLITGNNFLSMSGSTSLSGSSIWGSGAIHEANTNRKSNNYAIYAGSATSL